MLVRHLYFFVTLAREKHFRRAAEACNVTQPTLSAAIRKLEEDLDIRLVVRGHQFLGLTPEGERVLEWARQIIADYESLRVGLSGLRKGLTGALRLGVVPAAMLSISFLTSRFCAAHPAATVEVRSMSSQSIQRGLDSLELDAGLTYLNNEPLENIRRMELYRERYVFVTSRASRHAAAKTITWAEAVRESLCLLSEDMQNRRIINNVAASLGLTIKPAVVSNSYLGVWSHLRRGAWASIVPHTFFYVFGRAPDLVAIDLVEPVHSQSVGLVFSDRDPLSPMANALLKSTHDADFEADLAEAAHGQV
ncbi:MAG: LysR family transcriptional regulator [Methylocella sp.]